MKTAVAIRHLAFEDLGLIEPWLKRRGWRIVTYDVGIDELWKIDLSQVDLLIVLGGPIGANDDALYPCLAEEVELIRQRLDSGRALLGICLGAQLMARALGAAVTPMDRKEIGFSPLSLTPQGGTSHRYTSGSALAWRPVRLADWQCFSGGNFSLPKPGIHGQRARNGLAVPPRSRCLAH